MTYTSSVRFVHLGQVHFTFGEAALTPGFGSQRLVLPMKVTGTWLDPDDPAANLPMLLTGTVWADSPVPRWLGSLHSQTLTVRGYLVSEDLELDLSDDQLVALERARGEDDLTLTIKLEATLLPPVEGVHPVARENVYYRIARSRWLEQLDQLGSEIGIVLRVGSPLTDPARADVSASAADAASLAQATHRLRQARAELGDHRWEASVATCRKVLENLALLAPLPPAKRVFAIAADARDQEQRWAAIYYDVRGMASAAHHDGNVSFDFTWRRADAEAILAATAALLGRYTSS
jgi:hypothetical protein